MLMVTTTVRMVDGVHGNTTSLWPRVALDGILVLRSGCLQQRLVCSSSTGDDANHSARTALENFLRTTGELDAGLALIRIVSNNGNVIATGSSKCTTVADLLLDVGYNGTFGDGAQWQNVADGQRSILASVDELASVHAFIGDEGLGAELVAVRVSESNLCERCATAWVVNYVLDNASDVAMSFSVVERSELRRSFS